MRTLGIYICAFFLFVIAYDFETYAKRYFQQCAAQTAPEVQP